MSTASELETRAGHRASHWQPVVLLLLVVALGFFLRAHHLTQLQLWLDETDFYRGAVYKNPPVDLVTHALERRSHTTNVIGWPAIIWLAARATGGQLIGARMATVLMSTGAIACIFGLVWMAAGAGRGRSAAAFAAAALATMSMAELELGQRTFVYGGVPVFAALIMICHLRLTAAMKDMYGLLSSRRLWLPYSSIAALGFFIHPSLGLLTGCSLAILYLSAARSAWRHGGTASVILAAKRLAAPLLPILLAAALNAKNPKYGYRIYLTEYYPHLNADAPLFFVTRAYDFLAYHVNLFWGRQFYWPLTWNPVLMPLAALCVAGWWFAISGRAGFAARQLGLLATAAFSLQILLSMAQMFPFGGVRQSMFLAPSVFALTGIGVGTLWAAARQPWSRWAIAAILAAYLISGATTLPQFYRDRQWAFAMDDVVSIWQREGKPKVYVTAGADEAVRYLLRSRPDIDVDGLPDYVGKNGKDSDFLLLSLHWPVERDAWDPKFVSHMHESGYTMTLLDARPSPWVSAWEHHTSIYFPPSGYWVYRVTKQTPLSAAR